MRVQAPAVLVLAGAILAGCGGGAKSNGEASKPPAQVFADMKRAVASASSVHAVGSVVNAGQTFGLDLRLVAGVGAAGDITVGGVRIDIVRLPGTVYFRAPEAFYSKIAGPSVAALLKGKWLSAPDAKGPLTALVTLTDMRGLVNRLLEGTSVSLKKGAETTAAGQSVLPIVDTIHGTTYDVAATGKPYLVEAKAAQGTKAASVTLSNWGKKVTLTAPKGAVALSKLGG